MYGTRRYENLSATLLSMGCVKNDYEICVYNATKGGTQCTVAVHVDDLLIISVDMGMINKLFVGLKNNYGEITRNYGPVLNYLGMVFDLSKAGEVRMNMIGYTMDTVKYAGIPGRARSPATDELFDSREDSVLVPENVRA